jgi:polysaccharide deacetylase family sporulation protein PdaB
MKKYVFITGVLIIPIVLLAIFISKEISHADGSNGTKSKVHKGVDRPIEVMDKTTGDLETYKQVIRERKRNSEPDNKVSTTSPITPVTKTETTKENEKEKAKSKVVYTAIPTTNKVVALTFDDGPDDKYTERVLKILKEHEIKATFFVIGKNIEVYPEFMKQILTEGHAIGNHTWSHARLTDLSASQIKAEMEDTNKILKELFGVRTDLMRPPFGAMDERTLGILTDLNFHTVKWSVDTRDWAGTESDIMIDNVSLNVTPGGIVLQHNAGGKNGNLENTLAALPVIIKDLKEKGYEFVTVQELLQMEQ